MASQFDELAKNLAGGMSRREALRRFGVGLFGALMALLGLGALAPPEARAQNSNCFYFCKGVYPNDANAQAACGASGGLCSQCGPAASPPRRSLCNAPGSNAFCCPTGQSCCNNSTCFNLQTSLSNCGSCGHVCGTGTNKCCAGACVNTNTDANNCGACGKVCQGGSSCQGGVCVQPNCCTPSNSYPGGSVTPCGSCQDIARGSGQTTAYCWTRIGGGTFCGANYDNCGQTPSCGSDADCPSGYFCTASGDFCGSACRLACSCSAT